MIRRSVDRFDVVVALGLNGLNKRVGLRGQPVIG